MKRGKLITFEGGDGSGKETQLRLLKEKFDSLKIPFMGMDFPSYDTPSGRIVGGPLLGKEALGPSYFESPSTLDPIATSMYYGANRRFDLPGIEEALASGVNVGIDRYSDSNKACQGGKLLDFKDRIRIYDKIDLLEYDYAELPRPDLTVLLYVPCEVSSILKDEMKEAKDRVEQDPVYLQNQNNSYLELSRIYGWPIVECFPEDKITQVRTGEDVRKYMRKREDIHEEVWGHVERLLSEPSQLELFDN